MTNRRPLGVEEFIGLVREHQASIRTFVRMLGVDREWVDDVAQEALATAFRRSAEFDPARAFLPWVRGIVRNVVANERRKDARRTRFMSARLADLLSGPAGTEEAPAETGELLAAMNECLETIPAPSRELLERRYQRDEDASALSRSLGMTAVAVRQALLRTRLALQGCIQAKVGDLAR